MTQESSDWERGIGGSHGIIKYCSKGPSSCFKEFETNCLDLKLDTTLVLNHTLTSCIKINIKS